MNYWTTDCCCSKLELEEFPEIDRKFKTKKGLNTRNTEVLPYNIQNKTDRVDNNATRDAITECINETHLKKTNSTTDGKFVKNCKLVYSACKSLDKR